MRIIQDPAIPTPKGHYSPLIEHGGLLYMSGQLPVVPSTGAIPASVEAQTRQVLDNVEALLRAAGSDRTRVLRVRVYVPDVALWDTVNAVYAEFFGDHRPVRTIVPTRDLHHGCLVEVEVTALAADPGGE